MKPPLILTALALLATAHAAEPPTPAPALASVQPVLKPTPVPPEVREQFKLAPFYQKHIGVGGLPIVGSAKLSDAALAECAWLVVKMLGHRPDLLAAMAKNGVRFTVMAHDEYTTDVPEHAHLKPPVYWDRRARGLGATPTALAVSAAEENLLSFPGDPYPREVIGIHEFAHAIHEMGLKKVDPTFDKRLKATYEKAMAAGLWKGTYAAVNRAEYWAEMVQVWFDNNAANDALHNDINTREKLKTYDPDVAALCAEVFTELPWRYTKPATRTPADRAHLEGFDLAKAPHFRWRAAPTPERPRVSFDCAAGNVEFELTSTARDQLTQFLAQAHDGYFSGGSAEFSDGVLKLAPAERTPSGAPVPAGEGHWTIHLEKAPADAISAKVVKGARYMPKILSDKTARVQRIVRQN